MPLECPNPWEGTYHVLPDHAHAHRRRRGEGSSSPSHPSRKGKVGAIPRVLASACLVLQGLRRRPCGNARHARQCLASWELASVERVFGLVGLSQRFPRKEASCGRCAIASRASDTRPSLRSRFLWQRRLASQRYLACEQVGWGLRFRRISSLGVLEKGGIPPRYPFFFVTQKVNRG